MICDGCKQDKGKRMFKVSIIEDSLSSICCFDCHRESIKEMDVKWEQDKEWRDECAIHAPGLLKGLELQREREVEFEEWMKSGEELE